MNKAVAAMMFMLVVSTAGATGINVDIAIGFTNEPNEGILAPVSTGQTFINFSSVTQAGPSCAGPDAILCTSTITLLSSTTFESEQPFAMSWGTLNYVTESEWVVEEPLPGVFSIMTTGIYSSLCGCRDATPGTMNFTFQNPAVAGAHPFSASGGTNSEVPEPTTFLLSGLGFLGLGSLHRRWRRSP